MCEINEIGSRLRELREATQQLAQQQSRRLVKGKPKVYNFCKQ